MILGKCRHNDADAGAAQRDERPDLRTREVELFGIRIHDLTLEEAVAVLVEDFLSGERRASARYVVTPNAAQIVQLQGDPELRRIYREADLVVADGMWVIWASRLLGRPLRERVAGSDLLPRLCAVAAERGYRVFFLGGRPGVAERAAEVLRQRYPGLPVVGTCAPPFGFEASEEENRRLVALLEASRPDILFVALGFPKQERWIYHYARACGVPLSLGVGAALDFVAGTLRRAPGWMQRWGLEWLHRLLQEPRRLGRRYLVLGPKFVLYCLREALRSRPGRPR